MFSNLTKNLIELERDKVLTEVEEHLSQGENTMKVFDECRQGMEILVKDIKIKNIFSRNYCSQVIFLEK